MGSVKAEAGSGVNAVNHNVELPASWASGMGGCLAHEVTVFFSSQLHTLALTYLILKGENNSEVQNRS